MEGLEISEVKFSDIYNEDNFTCRIDAEYQQKAFLKNYGLLKKLNLNELNASPYSKVLGGKRLPKEACFQETGIKYCRAEDVKGTFLDIDKSPCISTQLHKKLKRYVTTYNDILITIVGNGIGDIAINKYNNTVINMTENCARIVVDNEFVSVLFLFFLSKYGQLQISRERVGTAQPKLSLERIRKFLVPRFGHTFSTIIDGYVNNVYGLIERAKKTYKEADNLFTTELDVVNWHPKNETVSVRKFSAVNNNNRYDAEYYQPKYDEIENKLLNDRSICNMPYSLKEQNYLPKNDKVYKYIELANIGANGEITGCTEALGSELPTRARRQVHCGDLIISSIEGSLQSCAYITEEYDNALCSTGFYVLSPKEINAETLLILFKSKTYQALLKKGCSGTILTAIAKNELEKIKLPVIPTETQNSIAEKVQQSFALRDESKRLLETAKRAVEIAIEEGEEKAVKYLEENK